MQDLLAIFRERFLALFLLGLLFIVFYKYRKFVNERSDALIDLPSRRSRKTFHEKKIVEDKRKSAKSLENNNSNSDID